MFDSLTTCPLTGLSINGRASFSLMNGSTYVLYGFEPIGQAIFPFNQLITLSNAVAKGHQSPRIALAGLCREASELGQSAIVLTHELVSKAESSFLKTFEEKRLHFMRLLYESGGKEHKKRDIFLNDDFPMAFAYDAEEFFRIFESLNDEELIRFDRPSIRADVVDGRIAHYRGVLLTSSGKRYIQSPLTENNKVASNSFHFGDGAKVNLVQGDGAIQTNVSGSNASVNVARGENNTQANQSGQPLTLAELTEALRQALSHASFNSCREDIDHELRGIELQLKKPEPKKSMLENSFDYLKELAIKSAGPAAAATVVELVKHAPELLAAAHLG